MCAESIKAQSYTNAWSLVVFQMMYTVYLYLHYVLGHLVNELLKSSMVSNETLTFIFNCNTEGFQTHILSFGVFINFRMLANLSLVGKL